MFRICLIFYLNFCYVLCDNWSENLFMKALKHSFPTNYSTTIKSLSMHRSEIDFFPFLFYIPYLNEDETRVQMDGYVVLSWIDPQLNPWNHTFPEWNNLKQFPLINFEKFPSQFPQLNGIDKDTVTIYIHSNGRVTYWAKLDQSVNCYRLKEYQYPIEKFQCDYDWMLIQNDYLQLVCKSEVFGYNFDCKSYFNATSRWKQYVEVKMKVWSVNVTTTYLSNPQRLQFSTIFSRKNINEEIVDYRIIKYMSVILVLQIFVLPNREERLFISLMMLLGLLFELDSLVKLTAIQDNPTSKLVQYYKALIIIQLVILLESLLVYHLISLKNRIPPPYFISKIFQYFEELGFFIRLPSSNLTIANRIFGGMHYKRRTVDDYIEFSQNDDLIINHQTSSEFKPSVNKKINVGFYDEEDTDLEISSGVSECQNKNPNKLVKLNWFFIAQLLDKWTVLIVIILVILCAILRYFR